MAWGIVVTVHVLKGKCLNPVDSVAKPVSEHHSNLTCMLERIWSGNETSLILMLSGNEARNETGYTKRWWCCHLAQCIVESRRVGEGKGNIATVVLCCLGHAALARWAISLFLFFLLFFWIPCKWEENCDLNVVDKPALFTNYFPTLGV